MRFSVISHLPVLSLLLGPAAAVQMWFHHNTYFCGGLNSYSDYIGNAAASTCYSTNSDTHGVQFVGVPGGAKGQVYTDSGCSKYNQEGGSGDYCLAAGFVRSGNWFYPYKRLRRDVQEGEAYGGVQYYKPDGTVRRILCSKDGWDKVHEMIEAGEWDTLETYPEDTNPVEQDTSSAE